MRGVHFLHFLNLLSLKEAVRGATYIFIYKYCGVTAPINRIYPLWGASPSRFIGSSPSVGRTNQGLDLVVVIASPTSVRVPSHIWFISFWSNHMCTTTTHVRTTHVYHHAMFLNLCEDHTIIIYLSFFHVST